MTTESEADRIYNKFSELAGSHIEGKRCALGALDEIIEEKKECHAFECYGNDLKWWQQVKSDLENINK